MAYATPTLLELSPDSSFRDFCSSLSMRLRRVQTKNIMTAIATRSIEAATVMPAMEPLLIRLGRLASGVGENGSPSVDGATVGPDREVVGEEVDDGDEIDEFADDEDSDEIELILVLVDLTMADDRVALLTTPRPPTAVMKG